MGPKFQPTALFCPYDRLEFETRTQKCRTLSFYQLSHPVSCLIALNQKIYSFKTLTTWRTDDHGKTRITASLDGLYLSGGEPDTVLFRLVVGIGTRVW